MEDLARSSRSEPTAGASAMESRISAVSWAAILAGAVVAAATSLLLMVLGTGFGLASSAASVTVVTAIALIVIQWVSAAGGGYITGRLRTKWVGTHTHEVFFRDTAHGFITWAFATLIVGSALASVSSSLVGAGLHTAGSGAASVAANSSAANGTVSPYDLDLLFRPATGADGRSAPVNDARAQAGRILTRGLVTGDVPRADRAYIAQLIAAQTGISEGDAQRRVDASVEQVKAGEVKARKAAEKAGVFTALSMLIGAFIASVSAAVGGRLRDLHP